MVTGNVQVANGEDDCMSDRPKVRWMVNFWCSNGGDKVVRPYDEVDFPQVDFWHPNRATAREEAARVLIELREERGDHREWVAAGHPDPLEVGAGHHPGGQWFLRYRDLPSGGATASPGAKSTKLTGSAAGAWKGIVDAEQLKQKLSEARRKGSRGATEP